MAIAIFSHIKKLRLMDFPSRWKNLKSDYHSHSSTLVFPLFRYSQHAIFRLQCKPINVYLLLFTSGLTTIGNLFVDANWIELKSRTWWFLCLVQGSTEHTLHTVRRSASQTASKHNIPPNKLLSYTVSFMCMMLINKDKVPQTQLYRTFSVSIFFWMHSHKSHSIINHVNTK